MLLQSQIDEHSVSIVRLHLITASLDESVVINYRHEGKEFSALLVAQKVKVIGPRWVAIAKPGWARLPTATVSLRWNLSRAAAAEQLPVL